MGKPKIKTLKRFGHKGQFVKWPSDWQGRMAHTGKRRFDTYCDLIVGMCACGNRHREGEEWLNEMLMQYDCCIEPHAAWLARAREEASQTSK